MQLLVKTAKSSQFSEAGNAASVTTNDRQKIAAFIRRGKRTGLCSSTRVGFLPWQKVFLPGQWKKPVKTGKNWQ